MTKRAELLLLFHRVFVWFINAASVMESKGLRMRVLYTRQRLPLFQLNKISWTQVRKQAVINVGSGVKGPHGEPGMLKKKVTAFNVNQLSFLHPSLLWIFILCIPEGTRRQKNSALHLRAWPYDRWCKFRETEKEREKALWIMSCNRNSRWCRF